MATVGRRWSHTIGRTACVWYIRVNRAVSLGIRHQPWHLAVLKSIPTCLNMWQKAFHATAAHTSVLWRSWFRLDCRAFGRGVGRFKKECLGCRCLSGMSRKVRAVCVFFRFICLMLDWCPWCLFAAKFKREEERMSKRSEGRHFHSPVRFFSWPEPKQSRPWDRRFLGPTQEKFRTMPRADIKGTNPNA